jgi:hypothetical protein
MKTDNPPNDLIGDTVFRSNRRTLPETRLRRRREMTPVPAKVLTVDKQSSQYRVLVQIELEKYLGSFHTLRFGENIPFSWGAIKRASADTV